MREQRTLCDNCKKELITNNVIKHNHIAIYRASIEYVNKISNSEKTLVECNTEEHSVAPMHFCNTKCLSRYLDSIINRVNKRVRSITS